MSETSKKIKPLFSRPEHLRNLDTALSFVHNGLEKLSIKDRIVVLSQHHTFELIEELREAVDFIEQGIKTNGNLAESSSNAESAKKSQAASQASTATSKQSDAKLQEATFAPKDKEKVERKPDPKPELKAQAKVEEKVKEAVKPKADTKAPEVKPVAKPVTKKEVTQSKSEAKPSNSGNSKVQKTGTKPEANKKVAVKKTPKSKTKN